MRFISPKSTAAHRRRIAQLMAIAAKSCSLPTAPRTHLRMEPNGEEMLHSCRKMGLTQNGVRHRSNAEGARRSRGRVSFELGKGEDRVVRRHRREQRRVESVEHPAVPEQQAARVLHAQVAL